MHANLWNDSKWRSFLKIHYHICKYIWDHVTSEVEIYIALENLF